MILREEVPAEIDAEKSGSAGDQVAQAHWRLRAAACLSIALALEIAAVLAVLGFTLRATCRQLADYRRAAPVAKDRAPFQTQVIGALEDFVCGV